MPGYEAARANMIERQLQPNKVIDPQVIAAFAGIRRELFVPDALRGIAYSDTDLPLGGGRYLMAPMVSARLIQAAEITRPDNVLVVGAGVAYEAAVIAMLARSVVALEEDPELARRGRAALVEHQIATVKCLDGPASRNPPGRSAYEIIFFAGAVAAIPPDISAQLAEGGRIVAVLRPSNGLGQATVITRTGGVLASRVIFDATIPLLPGFTDKPAFVF